MTFPINLQVSGSLMLVTGSTPAARMEINVPLTASQLAIGSVSLSSGTVSGDLIVNGTLIANEFKTSIVSSSIIYRSGSTKQGDSTDDIHEVTGSMRVVGGISGSLSGTFFGAGQGSFTGTEGLTGSLQHLVSGLSYLVAGDGISIVTQSNGQIRVSNTFAVTASWADVSASYVTLGTTGSLPNERALSASSGITMTDGGPGGFVDLNLNVSGGVGIQVITQSNGGVLITASTGSVVGTSFTVPREVKNVIVSGSAGHVTMSLSDDPHLWQEHLFKDADGTSATNNIIISASAGHRIDGGFGHEISSSYGRARLLFVGNGLWSLVD